jgi:nucleotide-binding universal stress UspA family protein
MFDRIVIATDGSAHGDRALDLARSLLSGETARLTVVHVTELIGGKGGVFPRAADEDQRRTRIASQVEGLQAAGVSVEFLTPTIRTGGPAHEIAEIADSLKADLIIVGSRGHSLFTKVVLGSVPIRLLQVAHCPVLVVPLPDEHNRPEA